MRNFLQIHPTALVTGASTGLGRAFAERLLAEGVEVWGTSRDIARLPEHDRFHPIALDMNDADSLAAFLNKVSTELPELSLAINNAGNGAFFPFEAFEPEQMAQQWQLLLEGPIQICRAIYPNMKARGQGTLVNVSSLAADFPLPYMTLYNTCKAGLSAFSRSLELEAEGSGVRVVDFMPGDFRTGFNDVALRPASMEAMPAAVNQAWESLEKHLAEAPEVAQAVDDLISLLRSEKQGVVTTGDFFQAKFAPVASRFAPWSVLKRIILRYYKLK